MTQIKNKRIIRIATVVDQTGIPKSSIYALIKEGVFPEPIQLSHRCVGFIESEVQDWIEEKIAARDNDEEVTHLLITPTFPYVATSRANGGGK